MTMPIRIFSLCLVALWLLASHDASAQKRKRRPASRPASGTPATTSPVSKEPRMNTATARDAAAGVNRFAVTLHQRLSRQTDGNLFFRPTASVPPWR